MCRSYQLGPALLMLSAKEVKTFSDEIPKVPRTAFADLDVSLSDVEVGSPVIPKAALFPSVSSAPTASLVPMFNHGLMLHWKRFARMWWLPATE